MINIVLFVTIGTNLFASTAEPDPINHDAHAANTFATVQAMTNDATTLMDGVVTVANDATTVVNDAVTVMNNGTTATIETVSENENLDGNADEEKLEDCEQEPTSLLLDCMTESHDPLSL